MRQIHAEATRIIDARPELLYSILADYHQGHPAIVPKPYFQELRVEKGGIGAGTEIFFRMKILGTEKTFHQIVSEPEPGRVLVEAEHDGSTRTTFTVDPVNGGTQSQVTIVTEAKARPGIAGMIERWLTPRLLRPIYQKELDQLTEYARSRQTA